MPELDEKESFTFEYSAKEQQELEKIKRKYLPKTESRLEKVRKLDKQAEKGGVIAGITAGIIGALLFGTGLCLTILQTSHIGLFTAGIIVGIFGMIGMGLAYPLHEKMVKAARAKIADEILALCNQ